MSQPLPARILVVDDAEMNRVAMVRILMREGYLVETASDGADALQRLSQSGFDLVLLDVMMPGVDGLQVIETMRQDRALRQLPVIMLSALHEQETVLKCIQLGAMDYLPKPINLELLKTRISACLENKRGHDLEREYTRRLESIGAQLQAANADLAEANQIKTQFLAMAAHDLKNPLTGILLMTDQIREEAKAGRSGEAIENQADRIHDMVQKMIRIINSLLTTAAEELKEVRLNCSMTNLSQLVRLVVRENEAYAGSKNIRLDLVEGLSSECWGMVDPSRISEAVDNLVNNAIKYSSPGTMIRIESTRRTVDGEERVHIEVQDQGPGLTPEDLQGAFGLFQRLSAQPTGGEQSTGVGLSIVKKMVQLHGGSVWAESVPGRGATFLLELPLQRVQAGR